jgi:DNA (cytosine-5)-methyltransferase 1
MKLLDLFCGAGGAGEGYRRAGFDVTGVDIKPMPRNPHTFVQGDALEYVAAHGHEYDVIHASPPCQAHTSAQSIRGREHPDLVGTTRDLLEATGKPYVIENVPGAPLRNPITLCGTMFGLGVPEKNGYLQRHRLFEFGGGIEAPILTMPCVHPRGLRSVGVYGHTGGNKRGSGNHGWMVADWREAMGIDWMSRDELAQAIPPAYTEHIARMVLAALGEGARR